MATVLVTGGSGNLARYVIEELRPAYELTLFDRISPSQAPFPFDYDGPMVIGELTSQDDCDRAIQVAQPDVIVHLGAIPVPTDSPTLTARMIAEGFTPPALPPDETFRTNVLGTYYLLDAAQRHGVNKIVAASSYFVLGIGFRTSGEPFAVDYLPLDEEHPSRPEDTYSLSKVLNEETYRAYARAFGIQTIALRLLRVTFPHRDDPAKVFNAQPPDPLGEDFLSWIEYVDARDVAQAIRLSIEATDLPAFESFIIGTDVMIAGDPRDVVRRLYPDLSDKIDRWPAGELPFSIAKARRLLGYAPQHSWRA